ncbi:fumarylacetoacetate hydrolase family protein [Nonomuraea roseoviolacea subsp. roseoviolacea]|uniref:Fumarylpyruvate hydrolase n=1 Tax=Nonomuraea roseoviolacea subsp. carminata TaxID=160689 RepID=A0ABT1KEX3_9ACTN|nr:fumarylacetoacetate hydrolase family protein [Nonomuraea roseoviolacea]MCP2352526.1 fumarylpyruvate hydrolase [Nonomuraea roseoviolacea subsp. carminata]
MTTLLWQPAPAALPVAGRDEAFPVRRVYCVGRNYLDHIREMREGDERDDPFFFQKPADAVMPDGAAVPYPPQTADLQFEGELVVAIGTAGSGIAPQDALGHVFGFAAGIDLTRRDLQRTCREMARPWEAGKSFDHSAPCGPILPADEAAWTLSGELRLSVNGDLKQHTDLKLMIWDVPEIISHLSRSYRLMPGDLIYTGTPAGVAPVRPGDRIHVEITGLPALTVTITEGDTHASQ